MQFRQPLSAHSSQPHHFRRDSEFCPYGNFGFAFGPIFPFCGFLVEHGLVAPPPQKKKKILNYSAVQYHIFQKIQTCLVLFFLNKIDFIDRLKGFRTNVVVTVI